MRNRFGWVPGDVLKPADGPGRHIVLIEVTHEELHSPRGINTDHAGLHGWGGMWYGDDPTNSKCFGKIYEPLKYGEWKKVGTIKDFPLEKLKEMVG